MTLNRTALDTCTAHRLTKELEQVWAKQPLLALVLELATEHPHNTLICKKQDQCNTFLLEVHSCHLDNDPCPSFQQQNICASNFLELALVLVQLWELALARRQLVLVLVLV